MDWCRLYGEMLDDPKVGTLSDAQFRTWVELLMVATKANAGGNTKLTEKSIDWALRRNASVTLHELLQRDLVTLNEHDEIVITEWDKRQMKSDSSAGRVAKFRAKQGLSSANASVTLHGRSSNGLEEKREDKKEDNSVVNQGERGENVLSDPPAKRSDHSRASRLPNDWVLPKSWGDWALAERPDWTADTVRKVADQFRDHWLSKGGADARKADWEATWRNWVRREKSLSGAANSKTGAAPANRQEALEARNQQVAQRWANGGAS